MTRFRIAVAAALVLTASSARAASTPQPFRLFLDVRWGEGAGSDAFRSDLALSLEDALVGRCFTEVVEAGSEDATGRPADLVLRVTLSRVKEELRVMDTVAGSLQPGDPGRELNRFQKFEVTVDASLEGAASARVVDTKHWVAHVSRQPLTLGEDLQAVTRIDAIQTITGDTKKAFCKSGDKQERRLREALAAPPAAEPAPR